MDTRTYQIGSTKQSATERAKRALAAVIDPELGLDIVQLGLVYDYRETDGRLEVDITLTTPGCPVSESLPKEAEEVLIEALPEYEIALEVVWDPPWNPDMMTDEGMQALGFKRR